MEIQVVLIIFLFYNLYFLYLKRYEKLTKEITEKIYPQHKIMNIDLSDNRLNSKKDIALVLIDDNQTLESNSKRIFSIFFQEKKEDYLFIKNDSITSLIHKYCFLGEILKKYNIIIFLSKIRGVVSKKPNFLLGLNIKKAKNLVTISLNKNNFLNKRLYYN